MKIAVTGASGNLGSALLRRIGAESAARGAGEPPAHEVVGISRRAPAEPVGPPGAVTWSAIDVAADGALPLLTAAFAGCDAVVHLAWMIQPGHDESLLARTNVHGSRVVLQAAEAAGVAHVVAASSVGAYAPGPDKRTPVDESWPVTGVRTSTYSRHKAELERLLDELAARRPDVAVTRMRPALIFQPGAASEVARLFLGPLVPTRLVGRVRLPVLPLPSAFVFQDVHADDAAAAFWTVLERRAAGAFNVAADPVLTPDDVARAVGAGRAVRAPLGLVRGAATLTWHLRLQPTDAGWVDLASKSPLLSTARLRDLGWAPSRDSREALAELVTGMRRGTGDPAYPPLHAR
jgi:nucleoside-diphosphate-sugar epimerase